MDISKINLQVYVINAQKIVCIALNFKSVINVMLATF